MAAISPNDNGVFGTHKTLQTVDPNAIAIKHKAVLSEICCFSCFTCPGEETKSRKYLYILENGYETNNPVGCCKCLDCTDVVFKTYFDRGIYDQRSCFHSLGLYKGAPKPHGQVIKKVCCCTDCCDCYNELTSCYFPSCCGESVIITPCDTYCCCCSTTASWCHNFCGLCGPKTGEPVLSFPLFRNLAIGEGEKTAAALFQAREEWKARVGHKDKE